MAEETQVQEAGNIAKRRRIGHKKGGKAKKRLKTFQGSGQKTKIDNKMKKLYRKRVRDYNSDDDDDEEEEEEAAPVSRDEKELPFDEKDNLDGESSHEEGESHQDTDEDNEISDDEYGIIQPGITKFTEGCKAFRMAFKKITKKNVSDDLLGPVLSAHKNLVAEKLAEEETERKVKGEVKKEKHLLGEKGHVKPANYLDSHEKFLIGVATKGVVKLFNAVNKAQNAQKGLNPSRFKDAKVIRKQRKEAFFSALGKRSSASNKVSSSGGPTDEGPAWAPLREGYMLTSSKLKNWDKMAETTVADDAGRMQSDSSSDDDY